MKIEEEWSPMLALQKQIAKEDMEGWALREEEEPSEEVKRKEIITKLSRSAKEVFISQIRKLI